MSEDFELILQDRSALREKCQPEHGAEERLDVVVLFTGFERTRAALDTAAQLSGELNARIRLVVPEVVPYPLEIDAPAARLAVSERRLRALAETQALQNHPEMPEIQVEICLCRDRDEALTQALEPGSVVVMAGAKHWWARFFPSRAQSLGRRLRRAGHQVIFAGKNRKAVYA